jgi:hypothetical protein
VRTAGCAHPIAAGFGIQDMHTVATATCCSWRTGTTLATQQADIPGADKQSCQHCQATVVAAVKHSCVPLFLIYTVRLIDPVCSRSSSSSSSSWTSSWW